MLLVVFPLALVFVAVGMCINAVSLSLLILPHALINITFIMNQPPVAILLSVLPKALVATAIGPDLHAATLRHVQLHVPLPFVHVALAEICELLEDKSIGGDF